tara:strand:+ start:3110 stop:4246 length:1137 start_codon:yes stop_codon:yes gene_type:complete
MQTKKLTQSIALIATLFWISCQSADAQIKLDVGGYMQNWVIANQSTDVLTPSQGNLAILGSKTNKTQGFRIRRARITAKGSIGDKFSTTTWIEFAGSTPSLLDFHVDAHIRPWFNIRLGQFMMPGQSFDTSRLVSSKLIFYERAPITTTFSDRMGYSAFRDVGIMAYGQHGRLWYGVHASNGSGRFNYASSTITERKAGGGLYGARVDWELFDGFTLGSHIATNQQRDVVQSGSEPFDIDRTSWSLRAATNNLGINGLFSQLEYMSLTGKENSRGVNLNVDGDYKLHGFYAELGYRITREWHLLGRYDEMIQKPGQGGLEQTWNRYGQNNYTFGISRYIYDGNAELVRAHLNYSFGESGPMDLNNSILVAVFQLRFIP